MTIYLDIIFLENLLMNYIILFGTGAVQKEQMKNLKLIFSSVLGALYAIITYLGIIPAYSSFTMKVLLSVIMIYIAFDIHNVKKMCKTLLLFYLVSFATGGLALALLYLIAPENIVFNNGVLVGTYPMQMTIVAGFLGFCIIQYVFKVNKRMMKANDLLCDLEINVCGETIHTKAFIDSGNTLKDPITQKAVIVIEKDKVESALKCRKIEYEEIFKSSQLFEQKSVSKNKTVQYEQVFKEPNQEMKQEDLHNKLKFRLIPFKSIGKQNGMLVGIQAKFVRVIQKNENEIILENVILGLYDKKINKNYSALIGLDLLQTKKEGIVWE